MQRHAANVPKACCCQAIVVSPTRLTGEAMGSVPSEPSRHQTTSARIVQNLTVPHATKVSATNALMGTMPATVLVSNALPHVKPASIIARARGVKTGHSCP